MLALTGLDHGTQKSITVVTTTIRLRSFSPSKRKQYTLYLPPLGNIKKIKIHSHGKTIAQYLPCQKIKEKNSRHGTYKLPTITPCPCPAHGFYAWTKK
jgi:hypothetical protein